MPLSLQILLSIALGLAFGAVVPDMAILLTPIGEIFIRLLKMIIVPLVLASITVGVVSLGDVKKLGKLGVRTLLVFATTTLIASSIGMFLAQMIKPGEDESLKALSQGATIPEASSIEKIIVDIVPDNIFAALATSKMLSIILFAILLGVVLTLVGKKAKKLVDIFDVVNDVMMKMTDLIMLIAPIGVFSLMAVTVSRTGIGALKPLAVYIVTVLIGLVIHAVIVLPSICVSFARSSPLELFRNLFPAIATTFSTSSSAAAMPITMDLLETKAKVRNEVVSFTIPLGTTINMDGTALYQSVAAIFIAQVYGLDVTVSQMFIIALTSLFASIAAAAIPSAGLITMVMILNAAGLPVEGISLIIGVDRILDMCRSAVNNWANIVAAKLLNEN